MSYIGNSPQISVAKTVTDRTVTDLTQSEFGIVSGYSPGYIDVFLNGAVLTDGEDYFANNSSTVVLVEPAVLGDKFRAHVFIPNADINTGYVKRVGDVMVNYASITGIGDVGANTVTIQQTVQTSNTLTTSSNTQVSIDSFSSSTYRSAKYLIQLTSGTDYHFTEISILHNGTTATFVQYGDNFTNVSLGTFATSIVSGNVRLLLTPVNSITTAKLHRTTINI
jgi:hypothetical protein